MFKDVLEGHIEEEAIPKMRKLFDERTLMKLPGEFETMEKGSEERAQ